MGVIPEITVPGINAVQRRRGYLAAWVVSAVRRLPARGKIRIFKNSDSPTHISARKPAYFKQKIIRNGFFVPGLGIECVERAAKRTLAFLRLYRAELKQRRA